MDWWSKTFGILKEESPYFSMSIAALMLLLMLLPLFAGHGTPIISDVLEIRNQYLPHIFWAFVLTFVVGVYGLISRFFKKRKGAAALALERNKKKTLLEKLKYQSSTDGACSAGKQECLEWANKTAPLLKYNELYFEVFMNNAALLPVKLSSMTLGPAVDTMKNIVKTAIADIENELDD